jgi:hypothetical protein
MRVNFAMSKSTLVATMIVLVASLSGRAAIIGTSGLPTLLAGLVVGFAVGKLRLGRCLRWKTWGI